ncbi:MAG: IS1380 family transposase [Lachnospiraceae bacterium]
MDILNTTSLESNRKIKINFDGGDLSSDAGLLLLKEFICKIGLDKLIKQYFQTNDKTIRIHKDHENLLQKVYQQLAGYFPDDDSDELTTDPVFTNLLNKVSLASQPTMSRFFNRMDDMTLMQLDWILYLVRKKIYSLQKPEMVLFDIDSTLFGTFGKQEGEGFNYHYSNHGYHPLLCYDGLTGDLLKAQLRPGSIYTSTDCCPFMKPLLMEYLEEYPEVTLYLRGDSGFADPDLFELLETHGTSYAIRLKVNATLTKLSESLEKELDELTKDNKVDYAVVYGEFRYAASSWGQTRRVVVKIEKPVGQLVYMHTFIVTNMDLKPSDTIRFYCNRGKMENFIKESKSGFDMDSMSSHSMTVNENRMQISVLVYNVFNWFRRLVLPKSMRRFQIDTVRLKLLKIAAKMVHSARYITFKLCSSCPYKEAFIETLHNIRLLPKLE